RRDAFVLTPLPVPVSVQMLGRLGGLCMLCAFFVVTLNAIPAITFPFVSSPSFVQMPRGILGHIVSTASADIFVFFSITALQGIVILGLGRRWAARLASIAQAGAVLFIMLALLFIGGLRDVTTDAILRNDITDPV